jgi:hypothetical protein
VHSKTVRN